MIELCTAFCAPLFSARAVFGILVGDFDQLLLMEELEVTKKFGVAAMGLALAAFVGLELAAPAAFAQAKPKVDCAKVMEEVNAGKKNKEIASDLGISVRSVARCKRQAKKEAAAAASPAAEASPAAAPAPSK